MVPTKLGPIFAYSHKSPASCDRLSLTSSLHVNTDDNTHGNSVTTRLGAAPVPLHSSRSAISPGPGKTVMMAQLTPSASKNFVVCIVMMALATAAVATRFLIKIIHNQKLHGSDWLCLAATFTFYGYCAVIIHCMLHCTNMGLAPLFERSKANRKLC
jgi:hypothetical protein